MSSSDYAGVDYSLGNPNVNRGKGGISYGLLSVNDPALSGWFWESTETVYVPRCPHCGNELGDDWFEDTPCTHCEGEIGMDEQWGDEPDSVVLSYCDEKGFVSESEVWVTDSLYYTHAQFCSPCMPGAGNLSTPCEDGPKTFCLGPGWFEGKPPYPIYRVSDGSLV